MNAILPSGPRHAASLARKHRPVIDRANSTPLATGTVINCETGLREAASYRQTLYQSPSVKVENASVSASEPAPAGFETQFQVALPYLGLFEYHVGERACQVDTASTLFVLPGREYCDVHPLPGVGHAGIIINLNPELVDEIAFEAGSRQAFYDVVRPSTLRLKLMAHHMMRAFDTSVDPLFADEWTLHALFEAFSTRPKGPSRGSRAVENAKLLLYSNEGQRLSLGEIASKVGVSSVYLTQEFKRTEGIPLYRFQLEMRMNRALLELPHCNDITRLALDLGFSNHPHFTSTFRRYLGITPSEYRKGLTAQTLVFNGHNAGPAPSWCARGR